MILRRIVVALAACGALVATAGPAMAAEGHLVLLGDSAVSYTDPRPGCYTARTPFTTVHNDTDTTVVIYTQPSCTGLSRPIPPGKPVSVGGHRSVSVPS
ncbi:hypothetical protein ABZ897_24070 [Nonomuraea sp. NPDC046802]|uniref:hypothetical protein n=1 Tax=Nonomuraea sp. NPDC046802 TaxID=3154919 RepID=UPI0033D0BD2C